jgi:hypothetical protein
MSRLSPQKSALMPRNSANLAAGDSLNFFPSKKDINFIVHVIEDTFGAMRVL